ncbi:endo-1,4-beta-xylanase [Bradyrhizobium cenepequi]|uniref:endo-1,4-beta-xylanase n=1 Tax=Bradyrhizobium cenepequi TaxID=2821403 RepID=UPI001CE28BE8|nr:endo-1,4-beta-xylanase [Bradyrhizobium cenepequi]MCA6108132.1 endo-1,4-beta-xylanase [Bradyrhizobium cenepequi]
MSRERKSKMDSLNATALTKGMMFGAAADTPTLSDASYQALYLQHCGLITTDTALKWSRVRPTRDMVPVWTNADRLIDFALANGIKVKGHNLAWNESNPAWLWTSNTTAPDFGVLNVPVDEAAADFDRHITETVSRYAGKITWWDVVNEPIEPAHGRADCLRSKTWLKVFGPSYIERAFNLAHAADPNAKLFMNEQAIERWGMEKNRVAFLNLVDSLLGKGVPIHGIGFESHIIKWTGGVSHEGIMWLLGELQKRNLEVHISEFDVSMFGGSNGALDHSVTDPTVIDPFVAAFARPYIRDVLSFSNVKAFISWELSDKYSDLRLDQQRPTLFDENMQPKQLALEVESAIKDRQASWLPRF